MRIDFKITLDSGGELTIVGEDLTAEDVQEVFELLSGYEVSSGPEEVEEIFSPPFRGATDLEESFKQGFDEARSQGEPSSG